MASALSLTAYKQLSESALASLAEAFERMPLGGDLDLDTSGLKYRIEGVGEYVFSKQPPARQIWASSPLTGSSKFSYDSRAGWIESKASIPFMRYVELEMKRVKEKISGPGVGDE
jgi:frataxin